MRWVILGGDGMLGRDLALRLGTDATPLSRAEADLTDPGSVAAAVRDADVVVNCAAFTDVDGSEDDQTTAFAVNATGAETAARAAAAAGARFVQVSTDYVFDGTGRTPYAEDAPLSPLGVYGASKAEGEQRVRAAHPGALIVRTAWLYGAHGQCFPRTILRLATDRPTLQVVDDQIGQPTWTVDVAEAIGRLIAVAAPAGTYHATGGGQATWFEFARAVFQEAGLDPARIEPTDSGAFARKAPRPGYSVLSHDGWRRAGSTPPRDWRTALAAAAAEGVLLTWQVG
jgi:dTDP-4-dehydrorhamnose reductase